MSTHRKAGYTAKVTKASIRRAVASSTAIETGQSVKLVEQKLRKGSAMFRTLKLASGNPR